ncbi:alpha/beta fold hydrolase [Legionella micdadei]|uniref:Homoserine O-acetyltransferase n=1 Tax=Legionella micdadei TaxID=451 RepID=A0A098GHQ2_LEGMI|nr:alpha/beta fold hydrolase [Legionella micdadei]ARG97073.1 homoserine acetyltransferase [Legionella micdadei]ARH00668.1 homoserine acetyltransferase [Legionella micdadei]KTD26800.1 alpha/beta hydrolase [Legionella micdadei]NSL18299.1 alpha/beta fold hydrolase [Legionella micdadei]CEG61502.1 Putative homoserine O-acetyltransferase [Legionella micdadei]
MKMINLIFCSVLVFQLQQAYGTTIHGAANVTQEIQNIKEDNYIIPQYSFKNGQSLNNLKIHYITAGSAKRNKQGEIENAVLFLHWTGGSGSEMFKRFEKTLLAPGQPFDAQHYFLIFPDNIGQGKSSKPSDGLRMKFPNYSYQDMVQLQHRLITQHLKISHLKMIVGTSMGGMHSWMWSELYPQLMDGVMAIVCLPKAVDGRNLLWRKIVVESIKKDPSWQNGNYKTAPYGVKAVWPFVAMMVDGVPHMQHIISNAEQAVNYARSAMIGSTKQDANDIIYVMEASRDYNPEPHLSTIKTKVFALDFTDDALDSPEFYRMPGLIKKVKQGQWILQKGTADSHGHFTLLYPELWANQAKRFVEWINQGQTPNS